VSAIDVAAANRQWELHSEYVCASIPSQAGTTPSQYTVAGAVQVDVLAVSFTYTASAAAGTRTVRLEFVNDAGQVFAPTAAAFTIIATNVAAYTFGVGVQQAGANSAANISAGIPPIRLTDGMGFQVRCTNSDSADTITNIHLYGVWHRVRL
jgi:FtsP/CotA-like multicopper oxidase with cupredoxin domain